MFLNVHDDIPSLVKGQVLHLMELHFFMEGVFEVGVFVCFSFACITGRSGRFRGRFSYAIKGFQRRLLCIWYGEERLDCR